MALIKQIKARLKVLYPGVNLSNKRIEAIAAKVDAKVTTEEEIDDALSTYDEYNSFAEMAKDDDRERLRIKKESETKTPEQIAADKQAKGDEEDKDDPTETKTDKLLKQALAGIAALTGEISIIKGEKVTNTRKQQYEKALEGTSDAFKAKALKDFGKMKFDTDEEFTEFLTETETDAADFIQEVSNNGLTNQNPVRGVKNTPGKVKEASKEEVDSVLDKIM